MSMKSYIIKEGTFRIHGGAASNPSKTLLTLYQRKGFSIARAGPPSPLASLSGKPPGP